MAISPRLTTDQTSSWPRDFAGLVAVQREGTGLPGRSEARRGLARLRALTPEVRDADYRLQVERLAWAGYTTTSS
jgi:hypothetical protein